MNDKLLAIYLKDHLTGATAGIELAKRCAKENREGALGQFLQRLVRELQEDRQLESDIAHTIGAASAPGLVRYAGAWALEKVARLKLNGHLFTYSPLSRLDELEGLVVGTEGRIRGLRVLAKLAETDQRFRPFPIAASLKRAEEHRELLEHYRMLAAMNAFANAPNASANATPAHS